MLLNQIVVAFFICTIGIFGIFLNRHNILLILVSLEIMFLGINLNIVLISVYFNDIFGQMLFLFVLTLIGAESAVGLAILITYYRIRGNIKTIQDAFLKK